MKNYNRDLLLLYKTEVVNEDLLQREMEFLNRVLSSVERQEVFCQVHELVNRYRITNKSKAILKATEEPELKPFCFLLNLN
jgi:hypothetical protein